MHVTATLKVVLRDIPETQERDGRVSMTLTNEPKGLPKGLTLLAAPLILVCATKQWRTACTRAAQIRETGTPALLIVEAHIGAQGSGLRGVIKAIQVVEGKKPVEAPVETA